MAEKKDLLPSYNELGGQYPQQELGYDPQQGQQYAPGQYPQQAPVQYPAQPYYGQGQEGVVSTQPTTVIINPGPLANPPRDHLAYAICVTIFCCWPIGIFAILKSTECRDAINRGDSQLASLKSREAKKFSSITLGVGIVMLVLMIAIVVAYVVILRRAVNWYQ